MFSYTLYISEENLPVHCSCPKQKKTMYVSKRQCMYMYCTRTCQKDNVQICTAYCKWQKKVHKEQGVSQGGPLYPSWGLYKINFCKYPVFSL